MQAAPPNHSIWEVVTNKRTVEQNLTGETVCVLLPLPTQRPFSYALPQGSAVQPGTFVQVPLASRQIAGIVTDDRPEPIAAHRLRPITRIFDCPPLPRELLKFIRFVAHYTLTPPGLVARQILRVPAALDREMMLEGVVWNGHEPDKMTRARAQVLALARDRQGWTPSGLAAAAGVSVNVVKTLQKQGIFNPITLPPPALVGLPDPHFAPPQLEDEQKEVVNQLKKTLKPRHFTAFLLDGVTGSGKTEIYFEAIADMVKKGQQVLILLPEIALTQQFINRFQYRFGARPAEWHSDISPRQRERVWRQVIEGRIQVVAGARSALFLPFRNLGLIVVDEEHDSSYKQEERFFYHARDMAVARGHGAGIPVILSSATPSIESQFNALQGRYHHLRLKKRFAGALLPDIAAIDMRKNPPERSKFLSPILIEAMEKTKARGEQSLLFLNRRGFAPLTLCRVCGHRFACPNCSSFLVEHRFRGILLCHHCGYHKPVPEACPECGTLDHLVPCGPGVERIAEEVQTTFPQARTLVLSTDLIGSVKQLRLELEAITSGEIDIIIGTQLVAKGHHFPHLTLVGVVDSDLGLIGGDPRAAERSFQLLSQVTGRAGREHRSAIALLQTYHPEHPVIQAMINGDSHAFYAHEMATRQREQMPPFGRLAALIVSSEKRTQAEHYARLLRQNAPNTHEINILGPAEAPLALIRGRHRFRLLIHGRRNSDIQAYLRALLTATPATYGDIKIAVDIDPQSFL